MKLEDVGAFIVALIILFTLPFLLGKMGLPPVLGLVAGFSILFWVGEMRIRRMLDEQREENEKAQRELMIKFFKKLNSLDLDKKLKDQGK